jgi:hypothetical protein
MPAGKTLINEVRLLLPEERPGLTSEDARDKVSFPVSVRAIRYAMKELIESGLARSYKIRSERFYMKAKPGEAESAGREASTEIDAGAS